MCNRKDMTNLDIRFYAFVMRKALALLKAHEPRVMTLEEVVCLQPDDVVWLEDNDKEDVIPGICCGEKNVFAKITQFLIRNSLHPYVFAIHSEYQLRWRCWNTKPTEEQRKAAKWNA